MVINKISSLKLCLCLEDLNDRTFLEVYQSDIDGYLIVCILGGIFVLSISIATTLMQRIQMGQSRISVLLPNDIMLMHWRSSFLQFAFVISLFGPGEPGTSGNRE